ncbi:MAG: EamA family transporter [Lachnospiraceae bacterium]|nr:EamA family transporter [Lachnospiraceae bacterium]
MESEKIVEKEEKKKRSLLSICVLQGAVIVFTMGGVCSKLAGGSEFLSPRFILFYGGQILVLAVYALIWQQIIKRVDLSVAYVNRATAILWSMLWAAIIFGEAITWKNIIGVLLVVAGTIIVNGEAYE